MIDTWIEDAARTTNEVVSRLDTIFLDRIIGAIRSRYSHSRTKADYLWEEFVGDVSRRSEDGWRIACKYPVEVPIMFFWDGDAYKGFRFTSCNALRRILTESPGFEFFMTNDEVDFVLCFNHHDYLIGVGKCKEWLTDLTIGSSEVER